MAKFKITGKLLRTLGYPQGPVVSVTMNLVNKHYRHSTEEELMSLLNNLLNKPEDYVGDKKLGPAAAMLIPAPLNDRLVPMRETGIPFSVFGAEHIEESAMHQMYRAAKLPISVAGALMPDAHSGYGLPIGGVLATENAVIPYGVGVDIGCRMCLSIFQIDPGELTSKTEYFTRELNQATLFGSGQQFEKVSNHQVIERPEFREIRLLRNLQGKAWKQLGSSGSGNHFVEFGKVVITEYDDTLGVDAGSYLGLLSHSGSRALGANVANHYTKLAKDKRQLPGEAANLAWLGLDEEEGMEYWMAMNLAGDYAAACHHIIHDKITRQLGQRPMKRVENHHNFAWKELHEGKPVIVHRKGATPAGRDLTGIIPGSMTADGFIVRGKGLETSVNSASHGAGRKMSRSAAMGSITNSQFRQELDKFGVTLIGGGLDESPFAYKDIEGVMNSQQDLVDVLGRFTPKIVKMDGSNQRHWQKRSASAIEGE